MLARIRKSMEEKDQGFTLVELLVVMIIIGILAAIAIPVFLSQRQKARETSAKSDVSTIGKEISAFYVDGTGGLTVANVTGTPNTWTLATAVATPVNLSTGNRLSGSNTTAGTITNGTTFCVQVSTGTPGDAIWAYTPQGLQQGGCTGATFNAGARS